MTLRDLNLPLEKSIKFGASNYIGIYIFPALLSAFKAQHHHIATHSMVDFAPNIIEQLKLGSIDFAFLPEAMQFGSDPLFVSEFLGLDEMLLVYPKGCPIEAMVEVSSSILLEYPFLISQEKSATKEFVSRKLKEANIYPQNIIELCSAEAIKQSLINGVGISILSKHAVSNVVKHGLVGTRALTDLAFLRNLFVFYPRNKPLSEHSRQFIELAKSQFRSQFK